MIFKQNFTKIDILNDLMVFREFQKKKEKK